MEIDKLPSKLKNAILLREIHDLSYQEIAETLNIQMGQVKINIFRARKILRETLAPYVKEGLESST